MNRPPWTLRRRIVHSTLIFTGGALVYLLGWGADTRLNETIATGLIALAAATIGSYVFGAVWDDKNVLAAAGIDAYREPPPAADGGSPA